MSALRDAAEEEEAQAYAELIAVDMGKVDWPALNAEIIAKRSKTALIRIKTRAWQILEAPHE